MLQKWYAEICKQAFKKVLMHGPHLSSI